MIFHNVWSSVIVLTQQLITKFREDYPDVTIELMDWEAHGNIPELPDCDLIGPTGLTMQEVSPEIIAITFALGVSTYGSDLNLFRQRHYIASILDRLRPMKQMRYYNATTGLVQGFIVFQDGTTALPMTKAEIRPWQYVQVQGLLDPSAIESEGWVDGALPPSDPSAYLDIATYDPRRIAQDVFNAGNLTGVIDAGIFTSGI